MKNSVRSGISATQNITAPNTKYQMKINHAMKRKKSLHALIDCSDGLGTGVQIPLDTKAEPAGYALEFGEAEIAPFLFHAVDEAEEEPVPIFLLFAFRYIPMPLRPRGREECADDGDVIRDGFVMSTQRRQGAFDFFGE